MQWNLVFVLDGVVHVDPMMLYLEHFGRVLQSMAELLAENYHNIWAKKKKLELEAKGTSQICSHLSWFELSKELKTKS